MAEYLVTIKTTRYMKIKADSISEAVHARDRIYDANAGLVGRMRAGGSPIDELTVEVADPTTAASEAAKREAAQIDRIVLAICQAHDTSELWTHTKQDPDAFRKAVEFALKPPLTIQRFPAKATP